MSGVLFFDGACGMCTRSRDFLLKLDRTGDLQTEPLQKAGTAERLGISPDRLMEQIWWLDASGQVFGGAEAANASVSAALGTRLPLLVYRIPGMRPLQDAVYLSADEGQPAVDDRGEPPSPFVGIGWFHLECGDAGSHVVGVDLADRVEVLRHSRPDGRLAISHRRQQATGCDSQYGVLPGKR